MKVTPTALPGVVLIDPAAFSDERGLFFESFNARALAAHGITAPFVQDNHSVSRRNVVRGLHYQVRQPQGKLVRVISGEIFDVVVDVRRSSLTFGKWLGTMMSAADRRQIWIPPGFAHGFVATSDQAEVLYKTTDFYAPEHEVTIMWNDTTLGVDWPLTGDARLSPKDQRGIPFDAAEVFD